MALNPNLDGGVFLRIEMNLSSLLTTINVFFWLKVTFGFKVFFRNQSPEQKAPEMKLKFSTPWVAKYGTLPNAKELFRKYEGPQIALPPAVLLSR